ncbi:MAG: DUF6155 family protein [bacterium]
MGIANIRKELNKHDKDGLIDLIEYLYKNNKYAKEYLNFYINPNEAELFLRYKTKVYEAFFPRVGRKIRLGRGKKAIAEFKKYDPSKTLIADLMLSYVEYGVKYIHNNGKYSMTLSNSIAGVYAQALALMSEEEILDEFAERAKKIVEGIYHMDSSEGCAIRSSYREFYG